MEHDQSEENSHQALAEARSVNSKGTEIWNARRLQTILDYADWTNFRAVIEKAMISCSTSSIAVENHFREFTDMVEVGSGARRKIENLHLSRYACYVIAMNGDPSKPEIANAQSYFAAQTIRAEADQALSEEERRIALRNRVKDANRKLSGAAKGAGVRNQMFGIFQDAGYKGLYGGRGVKQIKQLKKIADSEDLLDCIGRAELAMNEFRITQTEERLRTEAVRSEQKAIDTHHRVGTKVRKAIQDIGGTLPEAHRPEPSVKKLISAKRKSLKSN